MSSAPGWLRRAARSLAGRLDRLRRTFDALREQLRDAVSQHIGRTVADADHDLLAAGGAAAPRLPGPRPNPARDPMWDRPGAGSWRERPERWDDRRWEEDGWEDDEPEHDNDETSPVKG